jgi:hypothetical protein
VARFLAELFLFAECRCAAEPDSLASARAKAMVGKINKRMTRIRSLVNITM